MGPFFPPSPASSWAGLLASERNGRGNSGDIGLKEGRSMRECIIRMLEYADARELDLIYHFVLHLIDWGKASGK